MVQENIESDSDRIAEGEETGCNTSNFDQRIEQLYEQAQALKMLNFKQFMDSAQSPESDPEKTGIKLSQMVIKAIEIQLKILSEKARHHGPKGPGAEVEVIWEALLRVPRVGPIARRTDIREELAEILKNWS